MITIFRCCSRFIDLHPSPFRNVICPTPSILSTGINLTESAHDLGVIIDNVCTRRCAVSSWLLPAQTQTTLRPVAHSITREAAKNSTWAFISSRLDCCDSLLFGMSDNLVRRVQSIQNTAARLICRLTTTRRDHITPVLRQLHWLPVNR